MKSTIDIQISRTTLDKLQEDLRKVSYFLEGDSSVSIHVTRGDRHWESDQYRISITGELK